MTTPKHLAGARLHDVMREAIDQARRGDFRARRVTHLGQPGVLHDRTGIVTPHRDRTGGVDADDFAAQIWAISHEQYSDSGEYSGGYFSSGGTGHYFPAPLPEG